MEGPVWMALTGGISHLGEKALKSLWSHWSEHLTAFPGLMLFLPSVSSLLLPLEMSVRTKAMSKCQLYQERFSRSLCGPLQG